MLQYDDYCNYFAGKCKICNGKKRVLKDNIWRACACQYMASAKWQFEQINVDPPHLKYKTWSDFTGEIKNSAGDREETVGFLHDTFFIEAKQKAMQYCFGSDNPEVLNNRQKHLIIDRHIRSGKNIVIAGDRQSGKTLLAVLIIKEIIYASMLRQINIDFQWVRSGDVLYAARWDDKKAVDHDYLDQLADEQFLVLDGVDVFGSTSRSYGHTGRPDVLVLDRFFDYRLSHNLSTMIICSAAFKMRVLNSKHGEQEVIANTWGTRFIDLMTASENVVIDLRRSSA